MDNFDISEFMIPEPRAFHYNFAHREPSGITEVYMVGMVFKYDLERELDNNTVDIKYFTLELGLNNDMQFGTVLCAWENNNHVNFGEGPTPDLQNFKSEIEKLI